MIYVDWSQSCIPNKRWNWTSVSHLSCDPTDDLEELHKFAASIGLKRSWFQPRGGNELQTREAVTAIIRAWRDWQSSKRQRKEPDLFGQ